MSSFEAAGAAGFAAISEFIAAEPSLTAGFAAVFAAFGWAVIEAWRDGRKRRSGREVRSDGGQIAMTICLLWGLCVACLGAWWMSGRPPVMLGLGLGEGWRALAAWALAIAGCVYLFASTIRSVATAQARGKLAEDMAAAGGLEFFELRNAREAGAFQAMAITAGITEEIIFRGFVMVGLALVMPLWLAAILSAVLFIAFHVYQGVAGMRRIVPITLVLTALVLLGGSLWPAILVHASVDMVGGIMLWGARKELAAQRAAVR